MKACLTVGAFLLATNLTSKFRPPEANERFHAILEEVNFITCELNYLYKVLAR